MRTSKPSGRRMYLRGAWNNGLAVACFVGLAVVLGPRDATDDFGPIGTGAIFGVSVFIPWFVFSLLVGVLVFGVLKLTSGRSVAVKLLACFLAAAVPAAAVTYLLFGVVVSGSPSVTTVAVWCVALPLWSGFCWTAVLARRAGAWAGIEGTRQAGAKPWIGANWRRAAGRKPGGTPPDTPQGPG